MNEAKTRQLLIDKKLHLAGWNIKDNSQVIEEFDINLADTGTPIDEEPDNPYVLKTMI